MLYVFALQELGLVITGTLPVFNKTKSGPEVGKKKKTFVDSYSSN